MPEIEDVRGAFKKQRRQRTAPAPKHPRSAEKPAAEPAVTEAPADTSSPAAGTSPVSAGPAAPAEVEQQSGDSLGATVEKAVEAVLAEEQPVKDEPAPEADDTKTEQPTEVPVEKVAEATRPEEAPRQEEQPAAPKDESTVEPATDGVEAPQIPVPKHPWTMPEQEIDPNDPTALYVSPTTAKIPAEVMRRFNAARRGAASHTAIVLDAMLGKAPELDQLILKHRPEIAARYARTRMPLRRLTAPKTTKDDLRIRPTEAELTYLKSLVDSINAWLEANWPKSKPTDQSEVLTVLLDAYLPTPRSRKNTAAAS